MKRSKLILSLLGFYQFAAGFWGIAALIAVSIDQAPIDRELNLLLSAPFFLLGTWAGTNLIFKKKYAITLTSINQTLQLIQFKFLGWGLYYASGAYLAAGLYQNHDAYSFYWDWSLYAASCYIKINTDDNGFFFMINLVPIIIMWIITAIEKIDRKNEYMR